MRYWPNAFETNIVTCAGCSAIAITPLDNILDGFKTGDNLFSERCKDAIALNLDRLMCASGRRGEKIVDSFIINF
jgi:hypothetical protein